jgi:hypothetical protein
MRYHLIRYQRIRAVFIVLMLMNLGVYGVGQGWFGTPRAEAGRTATNRLPVPLNADALSLGPAQLQNR